jgi:hypothetical protein
MVDIYCEQNYAQRKLLVELNEQVIVVGYDHILKKEQKVILKEIILRIRLYLHLSP